MSKNDVASVPSVPKGGILRLNPKKLPLHELDRWGAGNFQLHEVGYLPLGLR